MGLQKPSSWRQGKVCPLEFDLLYSSSYVISISSTNRSLKQRSYLLKNRVLDDKLRICYPGKSAIMKDVEFSYAKKLIFSFKKALYLNIVKESEGAPKFKGIQLRILSTIRVSYSVFAFKRI